MRMEEKSVNYDIIKRNNEAAILKITNELRGHDGCWVILREVNKTKTKTHSSLLRLHLNSGREVFCDHVSGEVKDQFCRIVDPVLIFIGVQSVEYLDEV